MFSYHLRLALKSLRRNPVLAILMVTGIGLGTGVSTTFVTGHYVLSMNPIPHKSGVLYYVQMDNWDPLRGWSDDDPSAVPTQITYRDMVGIMKSDIPTHQGGSFKASAFLHPDPSAGRPYSVLARMCFSDFFGLFEVPFQYGQGWDKSADQGPEPVVVISHETNLKVFGGEDSVGRLLRVDDRFFKVAGVLAPWRPRPKYYDPHNGAFDEPEEIYLPFEIFQPLKLHSAGNSSSWKGFDRDNWDELLASEMVWIQMWVQLDTESQKEAYAAFLDSYVEEQKRLGRMERPTNNRLLNVMEWLDDRGAVPEEATSLMVISLLFLAVCALNLIGILLGKFLARAPEVSVRRAMGASRRSIFIQHLVECETIGFFGALLGIALSLVGLKAVEGLFAGTFQFHLDVVMLAAATGLALTAGALAGLYPAWRICSIPPAVYLRQE